METLFLLVLLAAPFALLLAATRVRRARESGSEVGPPWDRSFRSSTITGLTGLLLLLAGPYGWVQAPHGPVRALFGVPMVAGVVLLVSAYRLWIRGVTELPESDGAG